MFARPCWGIASVFHLICVGDHRREFHANLPNFPALFVQDVRKRRRPTPYQNVRLRRSLQPAKLKSIAVNAGERPRPGRSTRRVRDGPVSVDSRRCYGEFHRDTRESLVA